MPLLDTESNGPLSFKISRVGHEVHVSSSAQRWAALNLCLSRQPRLRRWILSGLARGSDPASLLASGGFSDPDLEQAARREVEHARLIGATILTLEDPGYPPLLRVSSSPPPLLYVRGRLRPEDALAIAVVGSRRATPQGQPGGKLPLFDAMGQRISERTIKSCIRQGWAEPWFDNPLKPNWTVCKITALGRRALAEAR